VRYLFVLSLLLILMTIHNRSIAQETTFAFGSLKSDPSLPVEITADELSVDQQTGKATFIGDVLITQGEIRLAAPRVTVMYNEESRAIAQVAATGGVTLVSGPDAAESQHAYYDIDEGLIVMTGQVLIEQGPGTIAAETMTVNLINGSAEMTGNVTAILQNETE